MVRSTRWEGGHILDVKVRAGSMGDSCSGKESTKKFKVLNSLLSKETENICVNFLIPSPPPPTGINPHLPSPSDGCKGQTIT